MSSGRRPPLMIVLRAAALLLCASLVATSPAQALNVRETASNGVWYYGARCGATDQEFLNLPRRAHAIRVSAPKVGAVLYDDDGNAVADVTSVRVRGHRVVVTARGAHAPCDFPSDFTDGWETSLYPIRANYTVDRSVIVFSCGNERVRPRVIIIACGDGNYQLRRTHWSHWGGRVATGRGRTIENDCIPYCAAGHFHSRRARVRLSRPRYCSSDGRWNYTRMTVDRSGKRRQRIWLGWICHSGLAEKRLP